MFLQVLESPEDTHTTVTADEERQGPGWAPVPPASGPALGFHRNWKRGLGSILYPLGSTVLLKRVVLVLLGAPAGRLGRNHVTGTPGRNSLA